MDKVESVHNIVNIGQKKRFMANAEELFPLPHISNCMPSIAAFAWTMTTPESNLTVKGLLNNIFAAQLALDTNCLNVQKAFEMAFWAQVAGTGARGNTSTFNETFWYQRATKKFVLLHKDGTTFLAESGINHFYTWMDLYKYVLYIRYLRNLHPHGPAGDDDLA